METKRLSPRFQCKICLGAKQYWFQGRIVRHDNTSIPCDHARDCDFCGKTGLDALTVRQHVLRLKSAVTPKDQCLECLGFGNDVMFGDGTKTCAHCCGLGLNEDALERLLAQDPDQSGSAA